MTPALALAWFWSVHLHRRRVLAACLPIATALLAFGCGNAHAFYILESDDERAERVESEQFLKEIEAQCPPQDGNHWYYDPTARHADRIQYMEVDDPRTFSLACGKPQLYPNLVIDGCTSVHEDRVFGGYYATTYAMAPWYAMSERWRIHEGCHDLGWRHEEH